MAIARTDPDDGWRALAIDARGDAKLLRLARLVCERLDRLTTELADDLAHEPAGGWRGTIDKHVGRVRRELPAMIRQACEIRT